MTIQVLVVGEQGPDVWRIAPDRVILGGTALVQMVGFLDAGIRMQKRDGIPVPPDVGALALELRSAASCVLGERERRARELSESDELDEEGEAVTMSVAEAAEVLEVSERQVRRMLDRLGGRRSSRSPNAPWILDRDLVVAEQARRTEAAMSELGRSDVRHSGGSS